MAQTIKPWESILVPVSTYHWSSEYSHSKPMISMVTYLQASSDWLICIALEHLVYEKLIVGEKLILNVFDSACRATRIADARRSGHPFLATPTCSISCQSSSKVSSGMPRSVLKQLLSLSHIQQHWKEALNRTTPHTLRLVLSVSRIEWDGSGVKTLKSQCPVNQKPRKTFKRCSQPPAFFSA